jgi:hypothetical protein
MTFLEAAATVLAREGRPLHYKLITQRAIEQDLLSHIGSAPEQAMQTRLSAALRRNPNQSKVIRLEPGIYGLRQWGDSLPTEPAPKEPPVAPPKIPPTLDQPVLVSADPAPSPGSANAAPKAKPKREEAKPAPKNGKQQAKPKREEAKPKREEAKPAPNSGKQKRKEAQPTTGAGDDRPPAADAADREPPGPGKSRRRRKRRRRNAPSDDGQSETPAAISPPSRGRQGPEDLVTAAQKILASRKRAMKLPDLVAQLSDGGHGDGSAQLSDAWLATALRGNNSCRLASHQRPLFALLPSGQVELTEWKLPPEVLRLEKQIHGEVARLRHLAYQAVGRKLSELPLAALVEIAKTCLVHAGWPTASLVRRAGEGEALLRCEGAHRGQGPRAIVVRRSNSEDEGLLRRRVAELRGSLHEQDCTAGLIMTTAQVKDETITAVTAPGAPAVEVWDQQELAQRMAGAGLGYQTILFEVPLVDTAFFTGLTQ